jgi:hypothetical protein
MALMLSYIQLGLEQLAGHGLCTLNDGGPQKDGDPTFINARANG